MSGHTRGPWEWWTSNSWNRLRHSDRGVSTNVLMPFVCRDGQATIDVSQPDMALIAAAPDLLAAAKTVLADLEARIDAAPSTAKPVFRGIADLLTAINKAEGRLAPPYKPEGE